MITDLSPVDLAKYTCAARAAQFVQSGMRVGLGTGSTAAFLVKVLGQMVRDEGLKIRGVPTSNRTAELAREEGIEIITLAEAGWLDLTIDGADEFDPQLNLIKGGGAAHLREKIVASASDRMIVITDASKRVPHLGAFPLPVEVTPFGWQATRVMVEEALLGVDVAGRTTTMRMKGEELLVTDEGNYLIDLHLQRIGNPRQLSIVLNQIPGVVENGLFVDMCDTVVIGHPSGEAEVIDLAMAPDAPQIETDNIFKNITE